MRPTGLERRDRLRQDVDVILASERDGVLTLRMETSAVDFKEEAGRRNGPALEPGETENPMAATKLADEVACMANSPGGGALILGVEDRTGVVLGTELNEDWLRQRIYQAIDVAPDIEVRAVGGQRLLVLYVAEAREPIADTSGRLRWRVGDSCAPVDRSEWWLHRERSQERDSMAERSERTLSDVGRGAMSLIRADLKADTEETDGDVLRRVAALRPDGYLTQAARIVLTPARAVLIDLTVLDVPGGQVLNRIEPDRALSLREQVDVVEQALAALIGFSTRPTERFSASSQRLVPLSAAREAILNGVIHRDWNSVEPTEVRWLSVDSTLEVRSPGGFTGGISSANVLSNRHARYPALADLFRALSLVEKQGLGVDRMYTAMIPLGHRPPTIVETPGPHIVCTLAGGDPVAPVEALFASIRPLPRQRDMRVAVIVDLLLRRPFISVEDVMVALQTDADGAEAALRATVQCSVNGEALIERYAEAWLLAAEVRQRVLEARRQPWFADVMGYVSTRLEDVQETVGRWCRAYGRVSTGDLMRLTSMSRGTAQKLLTMMAARGDLQRVGAGRSTAYRLADSASLSPSRQPAP